jgi:hypothetical protein
MGTPINFSKGGGEFAPLPVGTYDFVIKSCKQSVSKQNQNPQLEVNCEVIDGDHAGKKVRMWYSLLPQATFRLESLLTAIGVEMVDSGEKDDNGQPIMTFDADELPNRYFRCENEHREYPEGSKKMQNSFQNEGPSPFAPATETKAESTKPAAAAPSAAGAPQTVRRPRPASAPQS